ncbi:hypothetical protein ASG88_12600 [Nocardioides sp. Soil777]|uniref:MXAN_6640 family putative metalloprotease n=1 Tax=Nocardioides sp. Soil777 TaxID=1736409 RepID=UPI0007036EFE|nr:MXAN_6640 family putative metalloprotease [Nocardioides sp. Soil777]KRF00211.1 hypothetical protein ASG88_12600 [Nocardioides sp. Soil777]
MTDNPVRALATLALAACLALGLLTVAGPSTAAQAPTRATGTDPGADTLELRDQFFGAGAGTAGERRYSARAAVPRPAWDAALPQGRECTDIVCVHYVGASGDAPPMASSTGGAPDWVALTLRTAYDSLLRMSQLGWPLPPSDRGAGGTAQFDVYLQDLGRRGLYGYCAPEQMVPGERNVASSYCVLDNDFAEFPLPPTPSMRVTVAHELFHAVQFGLDAREDGWLLEATATWMEEQITDDVDDNRQYLVHGQLGDPRTPLDTFDSGLGSYGNWIFFQRLTQRFGSDAVRQVWARADGHVGRRNHFSVKAVKRYVESRGVSWPRFYAGFVAANRTARASYAEGSAYRPTSPQSRALLGRGRRSWTRTVSLDHLTGHVASLRPAPGPRRGRLRISVDAGRRATAPGAHVVLIGRKGVIGRSPIRLDRSGHGTRVVTFHRPRVRRVEVVVANASTRYTCNRGSQFACHGKPRDDRRGFRITARVLR